MLSLIMILFLLIFLGSFFFVFILLLLWYLITPFRETVRIELNFLSGKNNTATSAGLIFLIPPIFFCGTWKLATLIICGLFVGLLDDLHKTVYKYGMSEVVLFGSIFILSLFHTDNLYIPFLKIYSLPLLSIPVFMSSVHATNIIDGINGLMVTQFIIIIITYLIISHTSFPFLLPLLYSLLGSLIAFYLWNRNGSVFSGNCGSMALGIILAYISISTHTQLLLPLTAITLVLDVLSVIFQVASIQLFNKKIFKFSPVHHHFQLCGYSDKTIVIMFSIVTIIGSILFLFTFYYL